MRVALIMNSSSSVSYDRDISEMAQAGAVGDIRHKTSGLTTSILKNRIMNLKLELKEVTVNLKTLEG